MNNRHELDNLMRRRAQREAEDVSAKHFDLARIGVTGKLHRLLGHFPTRAKATATAAHLNTLGCRPKSSWFVLAVDMDWPVSKAQRASLRRQYLGST
ncbi:hypothetical protein LCGC14_2893060 [marine sediment metagenome]|uniref:Uncharacterized protein n=1 Tax=marine sediment metagenome TaxID=412755 RepID=A0A0F8YIF6_9ZZZZ